ncbi:recombinase [Brucella canis]|uniref:Recombinase family protein n=1 Tax=Brucella suis bv. 4 TaxID=1567501 RepID=A0A7L9MDS3_BRUSS|nr:helix-turn-helix domain-containing protein [Brucella melitensis]QOK60457.1 recombinase family protein [Brucella suis bv. 3]QOK63475.1 recombinase family protein [Brucella suis bv. 4]RXX11485.1 recombinase [Brucella canis]QOK61120.1 recombinase family protein [Brucella suis bv. 3]
MYSAFLRRQEGRSASVDRKQLNAVQDMLAMGAGTSEIAKATGLTRQTVIRIGKDPVKTDQTLKQWEPQGYDMQRKC